MSENIISELMQHDIRFFAGKIVLRDPRNQVYKLFLTQAMKILSRNNFLRRWQDRKEARFCQCRAAIKK